MSAYNPEKHGPINATTVEARRILATLAIRKMEALKLYRPMPFQHDFHQSMAMERIIRGGNRSGKVWPLPSR